jgi:hypothetical protein
MSNMRTVNTVVLIRQDWFIVDWYRRATANSANYLDKAKFISLKRAGDQAVAAKRIDTLRQILFDLLEIQINANTGDGMFDVANIIKG